jgi:DNA-binding MarR family transcriptional regulator
MSKQEIPLTLNEKTVLWALTKWPTANDRQLAQSIDIKMSTITAIRNRLRRANLFKAVRIPLMGRLGCDSAAH